MLANRIMFCLAPGFAGACFLLKLKNGMQMLLAAQVLSVVAMHGFAMFRLLVLRLKQFKTVQRVVYPLACLTSQGRSVRSAPRLAGPFTLPRSLPRIGADADAPAACRSRRGTGCEVHLFD